MNHSDRVAELYNELRQLAAAHLAHEDQGHSLQPTALVHEAWLRLTASPGALDANASKSDFFRAAAVAMQRILVDHARAAKADKRGGNRTCIQIEPDLLPAVEPDSDILEVNEALEQFKIHDPQAAELVCLRYFAGLSLPQAAEVLGISKSTADRWWFYAKSWFYQRLKQNQ